MTHVAIIADDLTGATDSAALFAQRGLSTSISLTREATVEADIVSVSTDSRDIPEDAAIARVAAATRSIMVLPGVAPSLIYKKLDSALRGHLRAELMTVMQVAGVDRVVVAPALPSEERTTRNGRQYINGVVLEESSFGRLGISSDIVETLKGNCPDVAVKLVTRGDLRALGPDAFAEIGIHVADARSDEDLDLIARNARKSGVTLLAGSAGLARAVLRTSRFKPQSNPTETPRLADGPILVIAGTQHSATATQIEYAAAHEILVIRPEQWSIDHPDGHIDASIELVEQAVLNGRHVIITTAGLEKSPLGAVAVVDRLSQIIESDAIRTTIGGVMLTGGDVAAAVCARLNASAISLRGEVLPAIPWGVLVGGREPGLAIVTKAGSFGSPRTMLSCIEHLSSQRTRGREIGRDTTGNSARSRG